MTFRRLRYVLTREAALRILWPGLAETSGDVHQRMFLNRCPTEQIAATAERIMRDMAERREWPYTPPRKIFTPLDAGYSRLIGDD